MTILLLVVSVVLIIAGTSKLKIHPFIVLFTVALFYAIATGVDVKGIETGIKEGFGNTIGNIGLVIIFGVIIGTFLEKTGAALKMAEQIMKIIGMSRVPWIMASMGFIISIPVFADSGFVILNALNKSLTRKAGLSIITTAVSLSMGLMATHTMVPPTPGPIGAAGILNAQLGMVILLGLIVSFFALFPTVLFIIYVGKRNYLRPETEEHQETLRPTPPTLFKSVLPILIPLGFIILKSLQDYRPFINHEGMVSAISFLGTPVIALFMGFLFALLLPAKLEKSMFGNKGWISESIINSAEIIAITGAGAIFGKMIQLSGIGDMISGSMGDLNLGLMLPFLIAVLLKTAQGSSTIAIITSASIVAPILPQLGLDTEMHKALTVVAIGAGSAVASHVNDSFFWVVTQLSGMSVSQGYKSQTAASAVLGFSALLVCYLLKAFL
ncbi:MAG: GntP family permease [Spirosomataceae bacterium]